jgi:hypothetical protein
VSSVKIGGSPLYYLPEQKERLQEFSKHLHQKEREAYEMLKEKSVLRDSDQEPPIKVALRNIKDFAWPLHVTTNSSKELFWKWYLLPNSEAEAKIKGILGEGNAQAEAQKKPLPAPEQEKPAKGGETPVEKEKYEKKEKEHIDEEAGSAEKKQKHPTAAKIQARQKKLGGFGGVSAAESSGGPRTPPKAEITDNFVAEMVKFFNDNSIKVLEKGAIRKNSEADFVVEMPSAVGNLRYYCKAKSKKRVGDGDLSSAYVQGELRKLPVLFISRGEPTKRAKEMLNKEFRNIIFKRI